MKLRNTSDREQHFPDIGTFAAKEERDSKEFTKEQVDILLSSPHIQGTREENSMKGVSNEKSTKGVDKK